MNSNQTKTIALGSGFVLLNIILIWLFSLTSIPQLSALLFNYLIVGVLVFGGILTLGTWLANMGIREDKPGLAVFGASLLQLGYGAFGSMVLVFLPQAQWNLALLITAFVTTLIAAIAGGIVYGTGKNFKKWGRYSSYGFMGVLALSIIGTFAAPLVIFIFFLALASFFMYLVYEIWRLKTHPKNILLNALGLYSAFMGVFIHILQIVVRMMGRD